MSDDEEEVMPIAGWMAAIRGPELTPTQLHSIKGFVTKTPSQAEAAEFDDEFDTSCKLATLEPSLFGKAPATRAPATTRAGREIRRLENKITPVAKRAALDAYRPLRQAVIEHIQRHGQPTDINSVIDELRKAGVLARAYAKGANGERLRMIRIWLRDEFGLRGRPGRPKETRT